MNAVAHFNPRAGRPDSAIEHLATRLLADEDWLRNALEYINPAPINNVALLFADPCEYAKQLKAALEEYAGERAAHWIAANPFADVGECDLTHYSAKSGYRSNII